MAAEEEAHELLERAGGDDELLDDLVRRRAEGEPLAWLVGSVNFCGQRVLVEPGVYVPRAQSEELARRAARLLPPEGIAADLCTGSGSIALVLQREHPRARVVASEIDAKAVRCAERNGVEVYMGSLTRPLPPELSGRYDVMTAVAPYVPSDEIVFLPRDVRHYEPLRALDGGPAGITVLAHVITEAALSLLSGGALVVEIGGDEDDTLIPLLERAGFGHIESWSDGDRDLRGLAATRS